MGDSSCSISRKWDKTGQAQPITALVPQLLRNEQLARCVVCKEGSMPLMRYLTYLFLRMSENRDSRVVIRGIRIFNSAISNFEKKGKFNSNSN
jgi:hypothetical protein